MAVFTTPSPDPLHKPAKAFPYRLALDDPESTARLRPIVGKPEKVEATRVFRRFLSIGRPIEIDQRRLFGMNGQVETLDSFRPPKFRSQLSNVGRNDDHRRQQNIVAFPITRAELMSRGFFGNVPPTIGIIRPGSEERCVERTLLLENKRLTP